MVLRVSTASRRPERAAQRQVDLAEIAGDRHAAVLAHAGENIFIWVGVVFCASVENDEGVRQGAAAHEGERRDLDLAGAQALQPPGRGGSMS